MSCPTCYNVPCTCQQTVCPPLPCSPSYGPLTTIDASSILYHKDNNTISQLTNLELSNGASLDLILETIDAQLGQFNFDDFELINLTADEYVIDNLRQFAEAVDAKIGLIDQAIEDLTAPDVMKVWLGNLSSDPGAAVDGQYWYNTTSNLLKIKVNTGVVKTITTS